MESSQIMSNVHELVSDVNSLTTCEGVNSLTTSQLNSCCIGIGSNLCVGNNNNSNSVFTTSDNNKVSYYVTMCNIQSHVVKNLAFQFAYRDKIPSNIIVSLKTRIQEYSDDQVPGQWTVIGPIVVWTDFFGYVPVVIPDLYQVIKYNV